jgi:hypothetical protein
MGVTVTGKKKIINFLIRLKDFIWDFFICTKQDGLSPRRRHYLGRRVIYF